MEDGSGEDEDWVDEEDEDDDGIDEEELKKEVRMMITMAVK